MRPNSRPLRSSSFASGSASGASGPSGAELPVTERRSRSRGDHGSGAGSGGLAGPPGGRVRARLRLRLTLPSHGRLDEASQIRELLVGDLGSGGVFVQCQDPPQVGERTLVEVCRPGGGLAFSAKGRVAWRRPATDALGRPAGFGLTFEHLDLHNDAVVDGLLNLLKQQQALAAPREWPAGQAAGDLTILTLDTIARESASLIATPLPDEIARFLQGYEQVRGRGPFLFRWAYQGVGVAPLSCVDPALVSYVQEIKILVAMYALLLDDTSDRLLLCSADPAAAPKKGQEQEQARLLAAQHQALCALPGAAPDGGGGGDGGTPYLRFARRLFSEIERRSENLGRYGEFGSLFRYDLQQLVQGARYHELLLRVPGAVSESESLSVAPLGVPLPLSASIDLCASPTFDRREVGLLREILGHAQRMAHIGQVLVNWERRCEDGALGNAVVAHGLASGALSLVDVDPVTGPLRSRQLVARLKQARAESHFLTEWLRERFRVRELSAHLRTVDLDRLLGQHQQLMWQQFAKKGLV